ncbi:hypothetical protein [Pararhizobium mangrovi]|uniref:Phage holin family protein n=1 Tax=Pararhizobium mangrovi TaxID=2590452 RepID=A0A506U496_9HYPH|nr:hypothetical protein [Pararhizobium mangrovi]TPW26687.1 hypothetical protein FJU11_13875 [Pararhizobium mangrovi]
MRSLLPLLTSFASGEVGLRIKNAKRQAVMMSIVAFFVLIAVAFGLIALEVYLARIYGNLGACLLIAIVSLVVGLVVLMASKFMQAKARRRALRRRQENNAMFSAAAVSFLPYLLRSRATMLLGVPLAAAIGYMLMGRGGSSNDDGGR